MEIKNIISKLLSPVSCALCAEEGEALCRECLETLPEATLSLTEKIHVLLSYRDLRVKKILREAKYNHHKRLYEPLVGRLVEKITFLSALGLDSIIIIPVPAHPLRTLYRGQDHTKALAVFLSKKTALPYNSSLLIKIKRTKRQALLTRGERLLAQKGSFYVPPKKRQLLTGKEVLLIDDIVTTGSTLYEAKKTLLAAGAKEVHLIALAH